MRPVVVTAILLVVMMFTSDSAAESLVEMCRDRLLPIPCKRNLGAGWFQMGNDRCVKAFYDNQHLGYVDAERRCNTYMSGNNKGHLVSMHSMLELNQVECTMYRANKGKAHYWVGLYLKRRIGSFVWTDGTGYDFSRWAHGQPDNYMRRELCVEMNYWSWGLWNDRYCGDHLPYVCAIRV